MESDSMPILQFQQNDASPEKIAQAIVKCQLCW